MSLWVLWLTDAGAAQGEIPYHHTPPLFDAFLDGSVFMIHMSRTRLYLCTGVIIMAEVEIDETVPYEPADMAVAFEDNSADIKLFGKW